MEAAWGAVLEQSSHGLMQPLRAEEDEATVLGAMQEQASGLIQPVLENAPFAMPPPYCAPYPGATAHFHPHTHPAATRCPPRPTPS